MRSSSAIAYEPGDGIQIAVARAGGTGPRRILPLRLCGQPPTNSQAIRPRLVPIEGLDGKGSAFEMARVLSGHSLVGQLANRCLPHPKSVTDCYLVGWFFITIT